MDIPKKILLVEDDAVGRKLISIYLRGICDVDFADDLEQGIEKLSEHDYDMVITDMNLGMEINNSDGMKLLKYVRNKPGMEKKPVVGITAHMIMADLDYYRELGFNDFMKKPIFKQEFIHQVKELLV